MEWVFGWLVFSFIVGLLGSQRNIGFFTAFFLSIFLSPIIGVLIVCFSTDPKDDKKHEQIVNMQKEQIAELHNLNKVTLEQSIPQQIKEAKELLDNGTISEEEFKVLKEKILS